MAGDILSFDDFENSLHSSAGVKPLPKNAPASSPANFPKAKNKTDERLRVLESERPALLARINGLDPEDRIRASKDLEALNNQIKSLGGTVSDAGSAPVQFDYSKFEASLANAPATAPAPRNPALYSAQSVPGSPEAKAYDEQVRRQAAEADKRRHLNESFISKFVAPLVEVPLAVATSPLGLVSEQLTGKNIAYQPQSPTSQDVMGQVSKAFEASKLEGAMGLPILHPGAKVTTQEIKKAVPSALRPSTPVSAIPRVEPTLSGANAPAGSVGAAGVTHEAKVAELYANASPELKAHIDKVGVENIDPVALETKILEEKHGIDLTRGQRTSSQPQYSKEWNARGQHPDTIGAKFEAQPEQFRNALDKVRDEIAPDIYESHPSELGQKEIDAFVAKDAARKQNIDALYQKLRDAYNAMREQNGIAPTESLPLNGTSFANSARIRLAQEMLLHDAEKGGILGYLDNIDKNGGQMTFQDYMTLDKRLGEKMREGTGSERAAAFEVRQALHNMELTQDAQALTPLLNEAKAAAAERFRTLETVPGYKQAVGEAVSAADAMAGIGSPNADTFHNKYVTKGSPADIKRIIKEFGEGSEAHQAMRVAELNNIKEKAGFKGEKQNFTPNGMNDYLHNQREKMHDIFGPEGVKSLGEINALGAKVAQPKTGVFNYSNTFSSQLQNVAGPVLQAGESYLNAKTGGASGLATKVGREWFANSANKKFGEKSAHSYAGISKKD